jgi:hypothetical protein
MMPALRCASLGHVARQFHAAILRRQHQFGAKGAHRLAALDALVLRHDQDHPVAAHRRRHRQRNAGIAGGGLDQRIARLDVARASARAIIDSAGRSLTEPAGLLPSSLARMTLPRGVLGPGKRVSEPAAYPPT